MLKIEKLTKNFGKITAVKGVTLELNEPSIVGLLGPNGSGKSTILRMMCGALAPTSGTITICGHDMALEPMEAKKNLGYLQETTILYKELKVGDYLKMVATLKRIEKRTLKAELEGVIGACNLGSVLGKTIGHISKGYRQRVGLAQAILGRPKVLLLDEPTASLDPVQAKEINALMRDLAKESLILLSTHILSEAAAVCSKIFVLRAGELKETVVPLEGNRWKVGDKVGTLDDMIIGMFA